MADQKDTTTQMPMCNLYVVLCNGTYTYTMILALMVRHSSFQNATIFMSLYDSIFHRIFMVEVMVMVKVMLLKVMVMHEVAIHIHVIFMVLVTAIMQS